jgi:hypothetical protein
MPVMAAAILLVVMLAGCTRYYYSKPGASYDHFATDHSACVGDIGIRSSSREYVQVSPEAYRRCMLGRGWVREEQQEPVEPGWFRGLERERIIHVYAPPPPPPAARPRPTTDKSESECRRAAIAGLSSLPENRGCPP